MTILHDLKHTRYELTKNRLSELPKGRGSRYILLKDFSQFNDETHVHYMKSSNVMGNLLRNVGEYCIGCRPFSLRNYMKIVKASERANTNV